LKMDILMGLIRGALENKVVRLVYRYLDDVSAEKLQVRHVQPIRWEFGKFDKLHVVVWDLDRYDWRRYAVDNIMSLEVLDRPWPRKMEHEIGKLPNCPSLRKVV